MGVITLTAVAIGVVMLSDSMQSVVIQNVVPPVSCVESLIVI